MNWLLKNFWLKIVAFALGLLVWFHVATEKTYNYEYQLPLAEITLGDGLALSKPPPDSLLVSVTATGKQLLRRKWRLQGLKVNASQFQAGRYNVNLSSQNTSLMHQTADVVLDEVIAPTTTRLEIDIQSRVELPIVANVETVADEGFAIGQQITFVPETATLIGPRSKILGIHQLTTEFSRLVSLRNPVTVTLPLAVPEGYGFRVEPESVAVSVPVSPLRTRVFESVPVLVFNAPAGTAPGTDPRHVRVEVTGPPNDIDRLDPNAVTLSVDYRERGANDRAAVKFDCPPGFRLRALSSDSVRILVAPNVIPGN